MRSDEDFRREIEAHIAIEADRLRAEGMSPVDAEFAARRAFGNIASVKERFYESRRLAILDHLSQNFGYAVRALRRSPGYTAAAVLSLALGMGVNTAVFSLIDAVILKELSVKSPEQLYRLEQSYSSFEYNTFLQDKSVRDESGLTGILAAGGQDARDVSIGNGASERLNLSVVSGNYFTLLGIRAAGGRLLAPSDDTEIAPPAAVLSYAYWKRRFGLAPSAIGEKIRVGSSAFSIVGVAAKGFFGETIGLSPDVWITTAKIATAYPGKNYTAMKNAHWLGLFGRLRPGVSPARAAAPLAALKHRLDIERAGAEATPEFAASVLHESIRFKPAGKGSSWIGPEGARELWIVFAVSALVLVVACVNVTNLLLARITARQREIGIRICLGAGKMRVMEHLLAESLIVAMCGGAAALGLAVLAGHALPAAAPQSPNPFRVHFELDTRMLLFAFAVSAVSALLFSAAPAWLACRSDPNAAVNGNRRAGARQSRSRIGSVLVGAQVALSLAVLMAAGLCIRSLGNLKHVDTGINPEHILVADVDPKTAGYAGEAFSALCERLSARLARIPGVNRVSFSANGLFTGRDSNTDVRIDNRPRRAGKPDSSWFDVVGPSYFTTLGAPILRGRDFDEHDRLPASGSAIVNESFAKHWLPGVDPIGHRIERGDSQLTIVGLVRDIHERSQRETPRRFFYTPFFEAPGANLFSVRFMVRTAADPEAVSSLVRAAIQAEDKTLPIISIETAEDMMKGTLAPEYLIAFLSGCFSMLAVGLAAVGLYGVLGYRVARRAGEIGIRMALGAQRLGVLRIVLAESLLLVSGGIAAGIPLGLAGCRVLKNLLFGIAPGDVPTIVFAVAGMAGVGLVAAALPARRAATVDPVQALRYE